MESAREKGTDNGCDSSLLLTGCGMQNLEKDIIKSIDSKLSQSGECMINMSEITTFKWDRMAVYDSDIKGRDVIKALGLEN